MEEGASNPKVSVKTLVLNNKGKKLFEYEGFLKTSPAAFKDNDDYIKKTARAVDIGGTLKRDIDSFENQLEENHLTEDETKTLGKKLKSLKDDLKIWQSLGSSEKKLKGLALLLPGTLQGNEAAFLPNIKKVDPENPQKVVRLTSVNLEDVIKAIDEEGTVKRSKNMKFVPIKDLGATGLAVLKKFMTVPEYKKRVDKGFFMTVMHPGGGYGEVDIKLKDDTRVSIETNESGHKLHQNILTNSPEPERLGAMGASVKKALSNYAEKIGITNPAEIDEIIKTGAGQMTTSPQIRLHNKNNGQAINILLNTGIYEASNQGPQSTLLTVKAEGMDVFHKASKYVVDSFANNIAVGAISKITEGVNVVAVSGPLAMGLDKTIKTNPELYEATDMRTLVFKFIDRNAKNDETIKDNIKRCGFDIVCDERVSVKNNTEGGAMLLKGKVKTFARRGEWIDVPLKSFKQHDKTIFEQIQIVAKQTLKKIR